MAAAAQPHQRQLYTPAGDVAVLLQFTAGAAKCIHQLKIDNGDKPRAVVAQRETG